MALLDTSRMKVESRMSKNASILSFYTLVIFWEREDRYALSLFAHLDFVRLYAKKVGRAFQGKCVGNGDFQPTVLPTLR